MLQKTSTDRFGIRACAAALGDVRDIKSTWTSIYGEDPAVVQRLVDTGLSTFCRSQDTSVADLITRSVKNLFEHNSIEGNEIDLIIHSHTLSSSVCHPLHDLTFDLSQEFGTKARGFSINQLQCSSGCGVLYVVDQIMAAEPDVKNVLFIGTDICIDDESRSRIGSSFLSDGAVAFVLSRDDTIARFVATSVIVDSQYFDIEKRDYTGKSLTNYELSSTALNALCLTQTVEIAGWSMDDVDFYLPFSGHPKVWQNVCKKAGFPIDQILFPNLVDTSHLFVSDLIYNLTTAVGLGMIPQGAKVACATFGEGRTFGCSLFQL